MHRAPNDTRDRTQPADGAAVSYALSADAGSTADQADEVIKGLRRYNHAKVGDSNFTPLRIFVSSDEGRLIGGLLGHTYWGWLDIGTVWVDESFRGRGIGAELMRRAEAEAIQRGCTQSFLDTFSFQARPFYERVGYGVVGTLERFAGVHQRFLMRKRLL